ncbi:MAG: transglycosylase SLT domain-containing protein [Dysgonamonadaceae bacterium]|jgi:membrane-bound lytic murein transglycosylase D|nr:transglycosylase SLT domain-containing protein [Dysgonamonadaceae bacterium]
MSKIKVNLVLIFSIACFMVNAQQPEISELQQRVSNLQQRADDDDETSAEIIAKDDSDVVMTEVLDSNMDSLLNSWYVRHYTKQINHAGYQTSIEPSEAVYRERLSKLPTVIAMPYNSIVASAIDLYVERRRSLVEYMLGLEELYFPMIEETLDKYGLPLELKYLVVVESAMNPTALSRAGASGMWQFMLGTGKKYGLEINSLIDERRDPIRSTDAACRYLKALNEFFMGNWDLAIAAYNCGEGNVNKAIKRSGGKTDFWEIYPYLPRETRSYLPLFIAATYVMNYYPYHQLYPVQTEQPISVDTVMVDKYLNFDQIADVLQIDREEIRALNPQYRRDIIPGNIKPYSLKLPALKAYAFLEKQDEIVSRTPADYSPEPAKITRERITHRVASGETIVRIAARYGVTAAEVRKWNGLGRRTNVVKAGRRLVLYVDNGGVSTASNRTSSAKTTAQKTTAAKSSSAQKTGSATAHYKVKSGDTYSTIAKKYGYSAQQLMRLNNSTSSSLRVGQIITVPRF